MKSARDGLDGLVTRVSVWDEYMRLGVCTPKEASKAMGNCVPIITNVIFNNPATIVFWEDGTKTVVKARNELFDPEKGIAMAIAKKAMGNKGRYFNDIKKWSDGHVYPSLYPYQRYLIDLMFGPKRERTTTPSKEEIDV